MAEFSGKIVGSSKVLGWPVTYLIAQGALILVLLTWLHGVRVQIIGDALAYISFSWASLSDVLSQTRTFGYPLLIRLVKCLSPDLNMLPQVQILLFVAAVLLLYSSLAAYGFSTWGAFLASSALFYQRTLWELASGTYSDLPALSLAVMAIAFLLKIAGGTGTVGLWLGLTLSTFLAYQMRPAYLFLIGLIPVLGVILFIIRESDVRGKLQWKKPLVGLTVAALVPFLAFASLRLAVVGNFGLVSFGGLNLAGITTQFMTKHTVEQFDADLRPVALAIVESRDRNGLNPPEGHRMWPLVDFIAIHSRTLTGVVIPTCLSFLNTGAAPRVDSVPRDISSVTLSEAMPLNSIAQRLALSTIRARPLEYILYCVKSFAYQISFTLYVNPTISLLLILLFGVHLLVTIKEKFLRNAEGGEAELVEGPRQDCLSPLLFLSGLFFLANILLTTFATPPVGRYLLAASAFVPSAAAVAMLNVGRKGCALFRHQR